MRKRQQPELPPGYVPPSASMNPNATVPGRCNHLPNEVVPVESTEGETVAHLCKTCDTQLPAEWKP